MWTKPLTTELERHQKHCVFSAERRPAEQRPKSAATRKVVQHHHQLRRKAPRVQPCPPFVVAWGRRLTCDSKGKKCSFEYESTPPGAICQNKDDCTCSKQGKWVCTYQATCIDDSPMYIETCPEVSPIVSKITACLDNSKQLCEYKYNTPMPEIPEGTCEHKDVCSCNAQWQWACQGSTKCSIPYDRP
jgi:hypothetical protein